MAKAALWSVTDAEARKRGERTGLDTPIGPRRKTMRVLGVGSFPWISAAANAL